MHLSNGTLLQGGKYKIEKVLGQGGFGITYLASQVLLGRKVCIKEFFYKEYCERDATTSNVTLGTKSSRELVDKFMKKFIKEASTISRLDHRNIIRIHDIFTENNTAYYVMEYHSGGSLGDLVKSRGMLPEADAVRYITQIAEAVGYIHERNINHLDIKPANILLNNEGASVLIDFGLSKQYDEKGSQTSSTPVGISHGYAPMEQYNPGGVSTFTPQSDIYSLGATLYKLVTGDTPPKASEILNDGLPALPAHLSAGVRKAIEQAMQPRKKDRPTSVKEFVALLSSTVESEKNSEPEITVVIEPEEEPIEKPSPEPVKPAAPERKEPVKQEREENKSSIWLWIVAVVVIIFGIFVWAENSSYTDEYVEDPVEEIVIEEVELDVIEDSAYIPVNDAEEAYNIGCDYCYGENGKQKDYSEAVKWFRKAAEQGHTFAQYNLGVCYYNGWGVPLDYSEAVKWYRKAAVQGYAGAQYNLGVCYYNGLGVTKDYFEAVKWYRKVAEQGDMDAQNNLGVCYKNGQGVPKDYSEAVKWYRKAAVQGQADAQNNLGLCYQKGEGVPQDYSEAVKWYRKATEQGNMYAQYNLGVCYENGRGVPKDYSEAVKWYRKAAEQGDEDAKEQLQKLQEMGY